MWRQSDNTDLTKNPICPHCGREDEDVGIELLILDPYDGDMSVVKCMGCSKSYSVTVNLNTTFSTGPTNVEYEDLVGDDDEFEIEVHPYDGEDD